MVSACLLGRNCKYNGGNNLNEKVMEFVKGHTVIPVCPEVLGGLPTPRKPAEIVGEVVRKADGTSVDGEFRLGAHKALETALSEGVELVILQPRSPSCGSKQRYDGTFTGKLIEGRGIFAQLLIDHNIKVIDADEL